MNIYLALALLLAIVVGRRLRASSKDLSVPSELDAPYTLPVEMTPAEREAMWARIEARIDGGRQ